MTENLSPTGVILDVLGDLELPLLKPIIKTEDGYEVMLSFPKDQKLTKDILKENLENKNLKVIDIDVFREMNNRYAWTILTPKDTEAEIG